MKILIIGAQGFMGRAVAGQLQGAHDVFLADRSKKSGLFIDLESEDSTRSVVSSVMPEAIVNCAGVVENSEKAKLNPIFTKNLLEAVSGCMKYPARTIMLGSAADYGYIDECGKKVTETQPLTSDNLYGKSKIESWKISEEYRTGKSLPVVTARVFNPLGRGMAPRMLLTRLLKHIDSNNLDLKNSKYSVSRLDSLRDYIDVRDVATAIQSILEAKEPNNVVYNVGSGVPTSNLQLIEAVMMASGIKAGVGDWVDELMKDKERCVAACADTSRLKDEFGWATQYSLLDTMEHIINE